jgi:hypothetical protein
MGMSEELNAMIDRVIGEEDEVWATKGQLGKACQAFIP